MVSDRRPHSRACGFIKHDHGPICHSNCPTCGGKTVASDPQPADENHPAECADAHYWHGRWTRIKAMYEERYTEGLTISEWHARYCAAAYAANEKVKGIEAVIDELQHHPHTISAMDVIRMLQPLVPEPRKPAPSCDRSSLEPQQEGP